jgi:tetratricopeptide (TPR) repeat protein
MEIPFDSITLVALAPGFQPFETTFAHTDIQSGRIRVELQRLPDPMPPDGDPLDHYLRGLDKLRAGQYAEAADAFTAAIELNPQFADAYWQRAHSLVETGELQAARDDYRKVLKMEFREKEKVFLALAYVLEDLGELDESLGAYTAALERNPGFADAMKGRALLYYDMKQYELSRDDSTRALQLMPEDPVALDLRARAHEGLGDYHEAVDDYSLAIEASPQDATLRFNRGRAHRRLGGAETAIEDFTKAIELDPGYAPAYHWRGMVYADSGQQERAIEDYTRAIELDPNYAEAYFNRSLAHGKLGRSREAERDSQRARELDPRLRPE